MPGVGEGAWAQMYITLAWLLAPKCAVWKLLAHKREENGKVTEAHEDEAEAVARRQTTPKAAGPTGGC